MTRLNLSDNQLMFLATSIDLMMSIMKDEQDEVERFKKLLGEANSELFTSVYNELWANVDRIKANWPDIILEDCLADKCPCGCMDELDIVNDALAKSL